MDVCAEPRPPSGGLEVIDSSSIKRGEKREKLKKLTSPKCASFGPRNSIVLHCGRRVAVGPREEKKTNTRPRKGIQNGTMEKIDECGKVNLKKKKF